MKKTIGICVAIFCANVAWAGDAEAKQFASLNKKIQSVQNSIPPMLATLESSLQGQIKSSSAVTQKNIDSVQAQITQLQTDTDAKLAKQGADNIASLEKVRKGLEGDITALQGQIAELQKDTDAKLAELNKSISGS